MTHRIGPQSDAIESVTSRHHAGRVIAARGIADPAVDQLIDKIIAAKTREELTIAARALDRVLRAGRYWIPAWYTGEHYLAFWDMFERPGPIPPLGASPTGVAMAKMKIEFAYHWQKRHGLTLKDRLVASMTKAEEAA